jgi:hypothetical protein
MRGLKLFALALCAVAGTSLIGAGRAQKPDASFRPVIPKTWDDQVMKTLEVPLAESSASPVHVSADYYYRIPVRTIYKTYPVYHPDKEPPGYIEWLKKQEPVIAFDAARLKTEADWIAAGEVVFDAPIVTGNLFVFEPGKLYLREKRWYKEVGAPLAKDGTLPFYRYVVAEKGKIEIGLLSCAMCHTRVMPDGRIIKGAQGNFPFDRAFAWDLRERPNRVADARLVERILFTTPWVKPDWPTRLGDASVETIAAAHAAIPPGVLARHRSSPPSPIQVPDLIGVKDRHYLDRSGLQQHHSLADLMRYAALNQGGDDLASYAGFIPASLDFKTLPDPSSQTRYSDEQLYALALYVYSRTPPPNPNKRTALAINGEKVFQREGCAMCHTPPLYTNNKLTPAEGFNIPDGHRERFDILPLSVGTDPTLTLKTRRGTGYYKVPSLKGVWYRGPFEHNGSVATLEDWFDPRRLRDDYVPTGFRGYDVDKHEVRKTRAVKGHEFGLTLSAADKKALIAFLKTL